MESVSKQVSASLSARGKRAVAPAISYFGLAMKALQDQASETNPDGYVVVAISENKIFNSKKVGNIIWVSFKQELAMF